MEHSIETNAGGHFPFLQPLQGQFRYFMYSTDGALQLREKQKPSPFSFYKLLSKSLGVRHQKKE